jgi:O-antigen/teichoic acid export membrane protein
MGSDAVAAFAVLALLAILQTVDVLVVGREAPGRSGSYAAISVTSKALVFVGFSLSQYLLPEAARRFSEGRHALRQLGVCLGLLAVPAAVLLAVAVVAPERLLSTVFGADLVGAAPALATLVLATASLATAVLFAYYLLGAARRSVVAVLATAAAVATVALQAADGEALATARTVLACNAAMAGVLGVMVVRTSRAATAAPAAAAASTA